MHLCGYSWFGCIIVYYHMVNHDSDSKPLQQIAYALYGARANVWHYEKCQVITKHKEKERVY